MYAVRIAFVTKTVVALVHLYTDTYNQYLSPHKIMFDDVD